MNEATETQVIDKRPFRIRENRKNSKFKNPGETITCEWCKKKFLVEKSYGFKKKGKRHAYKHRFCCRGHARKWYAKEGLIGKTGRSNPKWVEVNVNELKRLWQSGMKKKDVAKKLGVSQSTIQKRIKQHNIERIDEGMKEKIKHDFLANGVPFTYLASKYSMGTLGMKNLLNEMGLNYRVNSKRGRSCVSKTDLIVEKEMKERGYEVIMCGNLCLDREKTCLPLEICKTCTIKNVGKLEKMNFFDMVIKKENDFFLTEVKSENDKFSFKQGVNLVSLAKKGVPICLIQTEEKKIKKLIFL